MSRPAKTHMAESERPFGSPWRTACGLLWSHAASRAPGEDPTCKTCLRLLERERSGVGVDQ